MGRAIQERLKMGVSGVTLRMSASVHLADMQISRLMSGFAQSGRRYP